MVLIIIHQHGTALLFSTVQEVEINMIHSDYCVTKHPLLPLLITPQILKYRNSHYNYNYKDLYELRNNFSSFTF